MAESINFEDIQEARALLELGEEASLGDIKAAYRRLSVKYHPDTCKKKDKKHCEDMFKKVTRAKDIILSYCANYKYSFRKKDVAENSESEEHERHMKRFYDMF